VTPKRSSSLSAIDQSTIVFRTGGSIARADVPALCAELRALVRAAGADRVVCDVGALVRPDIATVDALACLQFAALRLGCRLRLRRASSELQELLGLMGLAETLGLEVGRQAEEREQRLGVEEEGELGDPAA
jgi:anti-anti-sigma regulatory factor